MRVTNFQMLKKITVTAASHLAKGFVAMITRHFKVLGYLNTVVIAGNLVKCSGMRLGQIRSSIETFGFGFGFMMKV